MEVQSRATCFCMFSGWSPASFATGTPIKYLMRECVRLGRSTCHTDIHVHWAFEGRVPGFIWSCSPPRAYPKPSLLILLLFRREHAPPCASSLFLSPPLLECGTMMVAGRWNECVESALVRLDLSYQKRYLVSVSIGATRAR